MNRRLQHFAPTGEQSGFVLIGVVIMALALTILGLSLFSLSNYESQFLERSLAQDQAENKALGEIERAKYRLTTYNYLMGDLGSYLPAGVTAKAWQIQGGVVDSTGPVEWDENEDVTIDVTATVGGITRSSSGRFNFFEAPNFYKRLIATHGWLDVDVDGGQRNRTVSLTDAGFGGTQRWLVWQGGADSSWKYKIENWSGHIKYGDVPIPDVHDFIAQPATPMPLGDFSTPGHPEIGIFTLSGPNTGVGIFRHEGNPNPNGFGYESPRYDTFRISGNVVLMFTYGLHLEHLLKIEAGGPNPSLTIVAAWNQANPEPAPAPDSCGLWLEGGILSPDVPVILVSDGNVNLEQNNGSDMEHTDTNVRSLSVFARNVSLRGPKNGSHMRLSYSHSTNAIIDSLTAHSALPNTSPGGSHRLALVPGTWRMSAR